MTCVNGSLVLLTVLFYCCCGSSSFFMMNLLNTQQGSTASISSCMNVNMSITIIVHCDFIAGCPRNSNIVIKSGSSAWGYDTHNSIRGLYNTHTHTHIYTYLYNYCKMPSSKTNCIPGALGPVLTTVLVSWPTFGKLHLNQ